MTPIERRTSFTLAGVFGLRMLGMFIILPVFALHAETLPGGQDHRLVGMALGAYGLTQALLQIPFGWLSDRWGRKPTIFMGLTIFAIGSFVAASADSIGTVVVGRVLQGAGAISAAVIALTADLTREEVRTKAMAIIGITIGLTFALSMVLGPVLSRVIGVPGIFAMTGVLALGAIALVYARIPDPPPLVAPAGPVRFGPVLRDRELMRLNLGIFVLHAVLMALFVVIPFSLRSSGLEGAAHWQVYLPVMIAAVALMAYPVSASERGGWQKLAFVGSVAGLALSEAIMAFGGTSLPWLVFGLVVFFTVFNLLEALLPALISRNAPPEAKGIASGVYATLQFLGAFVGAITGGWLSQSYGATAVYLFCGVLTGLWLLAAIGMTVPVTRTLRLPPMDDSRARGLQSRLRALPGVRNARLDAGEGVARLDVDRAGFDEDNAMKLIQGET
jgi:MFS family permease